VVKVMFLTAFLQRLSSAGRPVSAFDRALLYPMIHESNNDAASAVLARVGAGAVARVAREAGMRDYAPGVGWWAYTHTSAAAYWLVETNIKTMKEAVKSREATVLVGFTMKTLRRLSSNLHDNCCEQAISHVIPKREQGITCEMGICRQ